MQLCVLRSESLTSIEDESDFNKARSIAFVEEFYEHVSGIYCYELYCYVHFGKMNFCRNYLEVSFDIYKSKSM